MRSLLTWLAILGYGVLALGLPLSTGVRSPTAVQGQVDVARMIAEKDRAIPFPCMNSLCGCASAEQCFRQCCCTTLAKRLAFARRHRLNAALVASLEARIGQAGGSMNREPRGSCCATERPAAACCESQGEPVTAATDAPSKCCDDTVKPDASNGSPVPTELEEKGRQVTLRAMLACKGIVASWLSVGGAPLTARFELTSLLAPRAWIGLSDVTGEDPLFVPASRPPRVV